jgi:hypothetical protein
MIAGKDGKTQQGEQVIIYSSDSVYASARVRIG